MSRTKWVRNMWLRVRERPSEDEPSEGFGILPEPSIPHPRSIQIIQRSTPIQVAPTSHQRAQLIVGLHGNGAVIVDENLRRILPGNAVLLFPFQCHHYARFAKEFSWLIVLFEIGPDEGLAPLRDELLELSPTAWQRLGELIGCLDAQKKGRVAKSSEAALWLRLTLASLVADIGTRPAAARRIPHMLPESHRLARDAVRLVMRNLAEPLRLPDIAENLGVSETHLRRITSRALGMGLGEYIRLTRINKACSLLATTELSIKEVAHACGFSSPAVFVRTFAKAKGGSPTKWRTAESR